MWSGVLRLEGWGTEPMGRREVKDAPLRQTANGVPAAVSGLGCRGMAAMRLPVLQCTRSLGVHPLHAGTCRSGSNGHVATATVGGLAMLDEYGIETYIPPRCLKVADAYHQGHIDRESATELMREALRADRVQNPQDYEEVSL